MNHRLDFRLRTTLDHFWNTNSALVGTGFALEANRHETSRILKKEKIEEHSEVE